MGNKICINGNTGMTIKAQKIVNSAGNVLLDGTSLSLAAEAHGGHILQVKSYHVEGLQRIVKGQISWDWMVLFATPPRDFVLSDIKNYVYVIVEVAYTNEIDKGWDRSDDDWRYWGTGTGRWNHSIGRGYSTDLTWPGLSWPINAADPSRFYQTIYYAKPVFSDGSIWENTFTKQFSQEYLDEMISGSGNQNPGGGLNWYHAIDGHHYYPENRRAHASDLWYWTFDYLDKAPQHISNFSYGILTRPHSNNYPLDHAFSFERMHRITLIEIGEQSTNNPKRNTQAQQSSVDRTRLNKIIGGVSVSTISTSLGSWSTSYTPTNYIKVDIPHSSTPSVGDKSVDILVSNTSDGLVRTFRIYKNNVLLHTFEMDVGVQNVYLQDANNINFNETYQYKLETEAKLYNNSSAAVTSSITTPSSFQPLGASSLSTTNHYLEYTDSTKKQSLVIEFDDVGPWYDVSRYVWNLADPGPAGKINIGRPNTALLTAQTNGQYFYLNRPEGAGSQTHTDLEIDYNTVPSVGNLNYNGRIKIVYDATLSSLGKYRLFIDELPEGIDQTNAESGVYAAYGDPTAILLGVTKPYYGNGTPYHIDSTNGYLRHLVSFSIDTVNNNQLYLETKDSNGNSVTQFIIQPDLAHNDGSSSPNGSNPKTITTGYWGDGTVFPTTETMTGSFSWTTPIAGVHTLANGLPTVTWNVNLPSTSGIHFHVSIYNPNDTVNSQISGNSNFSLTALEVDIANSWEPFATNSIAAKDPVYTNFSITEVLSRGNEIGHVKPGDTVRIKAKFFYVSDGHDLSKLNHSYNGQIYNVWQLGKHYEPEWSKTVDITIPEFVTVTNRNYYHNFSWNNLPNSSNVTGYRVYYNDVSNVTSDQGASRLAGVYGENGTAKYRDFNKKSIGSYSLNVANVSHDHGLLIGQKIAGVGFTSGSANTGTGSTKALDEVINQCMDILVDSNGVIYLLVRGEIKKLTLQSDGTYNIETWVGSQLSGYVDGQTTSARFGFIEYGCIDSNDNIYLTDRDNLAVRKVTPTGTVTTIAGGPPHGVGDGNPFGDLPNNPLLKGIAIDSNGDLYVGRNWGESVSKVTQAGVVSTFWSAPTANGNIHDVAIDSNDNIYAAAKYQQVYKIAPNGTGVTLTGTAYGQGSGNVVGTLSQARYNQIQALSWDETTDKLYVGDASGLKVVDEANNSVTHFSDHHLNIGGQYKYRRLKNNEGFISIGQFGSTIYKYTSVPDDYFMNTDDADTDTDRTKIFTFWDGNNVPKSSGDSSVTVRKFFGIGALEGSYLCPVQIEEVPVVLNPNLNSSSTYTIDGLTGVSMSQNFIGNYTYFKIDWNPASAIGLSYVVIERTAPTTATFRVAPQLGTYNDFPSVQGGNPGGNVPAGDTYTYEIYGERWCDPTGQSGETWGSMRTTKAQATVTTRSLVSVVNTPTADFTFVIAPSGSNWQVTFTNTSVVNNSSATITSYLWDFGDGNSSSLENPVHTFTSGNSFYNVNLTVTQDVASLTDTVTKQVPFNVDIEVLLVGGGGSGARGSYNPQGNGGGGGAGAAYFLSGSNKLSVPAYTDLYFVVGAGGTIPGFQARGNNGGTTSIVYSSQYDAGGGGGGGDGSSSSNVNGGDAPTQSGSPTGFFRGNGGGGGVYLFSQGTGGAGTYQGYGATGSSGHGAGVNGQGATQTSIGPGQNIGTGSGNNDKTFRSVSTYIIGQGGNGQPLTSSSPITNPITGAGSGGYGGQSNPNFYGQGNVPSAGNDGGVYIKVPSTYMISNNAGWQMDQGNYSFGGVTYDFYYVETNGVHNIQVVGPFGN